MHPLERYKEKVVVKKQHFFVRDYKFFIDYSFGALYCYQKIGCFKTAWGTIQFFIFNHSDLGDFFNFFWGFFVIFENAWKAHLVLVHCSNLHFTLFVFSFEIFDDWRFIWCFLFLWSEVWKEGPTQGWFSTPLGLKFTGKITFQLIFEIYLDTWIRQCCIQNVNIFCKEL